MNNQLNFEKVIIFVSSPLHKRDLNRLGISYLIKKNIDFKIFNFSPIVNLKLYRNSAFEDKLNLSQQIFIKNNEQIKTHINSISNKTIIFSFLHFNKYTFRIFREISINKIPYVHFIINVIPDLNYYNNLKLKKIKNINFFKIFKIITNRIFHPSLSKFYRIKEPLFAVLGADYSLLHSQAKLIGKNTSIIWAHTFDYDQYLKLNKYSKKNMKKFAVFIDAPYPMFPNDIYVDSISNPLTKDKYYPSLCKFFDFLEKKFKVDIIIASHPNSYHGSKPECYGFRETIKGQTLSLIKESLFVINRNSTAINFAILLKKPMIFHTSKEIEHSFTMHQQINNFALFFDKKPINIDKSYSNIDWKNELEINLNKYANYKESFIKKKISPNNIIWDIVYNKIF